MALDNAERKHRHKIIKNRKRRHKPNKKRINETRYMNKVRVRQKARSCQKKGRYKTREEAEAITKEYNDRVLFADFEPYFCYRHERWHVGHKNKWMIKGKTNENK